MSDEPADVLRNREWAPPPSKEPLPDDGSFFLHLSPADAGLLWVALGRQLRVRPGGPDAARARRLLVELYDHFPAPTPGEAHDL